MDLMAFWRKKFPEKIYDIDYELLTENQEEETRKLLAYCELDWERDCLDFQNNVRSVLTASSEQMRKRMYKGSSEAWRKYEIHIQPMIKILEK